MPQPKRMTSSKISIFAMLLTGTGIVAVSAFYVSSFLAIIGVAIILWGAIFFYVTPSKHVPLKLISVSAEAVAANIERLILELKMIERGVYLPPKNLRNINSSLVFIPETLKTPFPSPEETNEKLLTDKKTGAFVSPPGLALSLLFEEELGFPFTKWDLNQFQCRLPNLFIEELELTENVEIQIQGNKVTVETSGSIFDEICRQTDSQPRTHQQVGCLLSSAIACALAKASGKPVIIQNENRSRETKTTRIEYQIVEG